MNSEKFRRKVCSLLVDGSLAVDANRSKYTVYSRRYEQLRKKNPQAIFTIERALRIVIEDTRMLLDR